MAETTKSLRPSPDALLNPRLDIVFKSIFTQDSEDGCLARNSLISSLTGLEITETKVLNNDIPVEQCLVEKQIRLDLHCKVTTGETVSVEMQMECGKYNIPNRLEYYVARLLSGTQNVDDNYLHISKVFQIMICDFTLVEGAKDPLLINTMKNQHGQNFGNLMNIITLELPKIKLPKTEIEKISDTELESWYENLTSAEKWAIFFKWADDPKKNKRLLPLFDKNKGIQTARRILMQVSQKEIDWAMAESRRKFIMDYTSDCAAYKQEGLEEGLKKGRAESQATINSLNARIRELEAQLGR